MAGCAMPTTRVKFMGNSVELAARLHMPPGKPRATAVFAHCFTCSKDIRAAVRIADALEARGIAVLRFDFTGIGQSKGEFTESNFSSDVADLVAAARYLEANHQAPGLLIGHSLGGAAVLSAVRDIPSVKAVATLGSPAHASHVEKLLKSKADEIERDGEAEVEIGGRPFRIKKQFLDDLREQSVPECVAKLEASLLVCHAPLDEIVGIENASEIFLAAKHPKSFLSLDTADHLLSREEDANYAAECIASWASRYLPGQEEHDEHDVITTTGPTGFATEVIAGGHRLRADEPKSVGGSETGPTPYGYLLAALGACTSMTLRMYADRKKLALKSVSVHLRHDKVHAADSEACETSGGKVDQITRELLLVGDLTVEQRQRLLEIADKCPVHKTLHSEVHVKTRLAEDA